jgi:hypothetical protein
MERLALIFTICKYSFGNMQNGGKFINVELIGQTDFNLGSGMAAKSLKALLGTAVPSQMAVWNYALREYFENNTN